MHNDITGIILCGGKSSRMGENKSFLELNGENVIEVISKLIKKHFAKVIAITNEPKLYEFLNIDLFEDIYKNKGPLGGIHSGLFHSMTEKNFIISCDMPLVKAELINYIIEHSGNAQITAVKADGHVQRLCALYKKDCLKISEIILTEEHPEPQVQCRVSRLFDNVNSLILDESDIPFEMNNQFLNLNKKCDYEHLINIHLNI